VGKVAPKAPKDASKEARKLKNRSRWRKLSQKFGVARTKNARYVIEQIKVDLICASLVVCFFKALAQ